MTIWSIVLLTSIFRLPIVLTLLTPSLGSNEAQQPQTENDQAPLKAGPPCQARVEGRAEVRAWNSRNARLGTSLLRI